MELCRATLADSISVVTNGAYGLVLLHLPPPHKPGVYNPTTGFTLLDMSHVRGYFNNLALADFFLGKLRRAMEGSGQWDNNWVIVSSDHCWRWSKEWDGKRDPRVPFMIKAPGLNRPVVYSPELNTVITHDLVLAILRGELTNQQQSVAWLGTHPSTQSPVNNGFGSE